MKKLKFAIIGTGFWAHYQISAWYELDGVEVIALYNRTLNKAAHVAQQFQVPHIYDDLDQLLDSHAHELDFVDIITDVNTHAYFTKKAAARGVNVICQKPMAPNAATAKEMLESCMRAGVRFLIHENFRWQTPIRKIKSLLESGLIGKPFKARVSFCSAFPVFENQPFLADLDQFILTDIGSHTLDICRFLFGETASLYCRTSQVNPTIKGEDVANVLMQMRSGLTCYAEMSYASIFEKESFPQTLVIVEGSLGSMALTHDYKLKITTRNQEGLTETRELVAPPEQYTWADPAYALVHSSIVACSRNLVADLRGERHAETTGEDNFETVRLVHAAYDSAARNEVINL